MQLFEISKKNQHFPEDIFPYSHSSTQKNIKLKFKFIKL